MLLLAAGTAVWAVVLLPVCVMTYISFAMGEAGYATPTGLHGVLVAIWPFVIVAGVSGAWLARMRGRELLACLLLASPVAPPLAASFF